MTAPRWTSAFLSGKRWWKHSNLQNIEMQREEFLFFPAWNRWDRDCKCLQNGKETLQLTSKILQNCLFWAARGENQYSIPFHLNCPPHFSFELLHQSNNPLTRLRSPRWHLCLLRPAPRVVSKWFLFFLARPFWDLIEDLAQTELAVFNFLHQLATPDHGYHNSPNAWLAVETRSWAFIVIS